MFLCVSARPSVVPHITDAIQEWVMRQAKVSVDEDGVEPQVCVIEVERQVCVIEVERKDKKRQALNFELAAC